MIQQVDVEKLKRLVARYTKTQLYAWGRLGKETVWLVLKRGRAQDAKIRRLSQLLCVKPTDLIVGEWKYPKEYESKNPVVQIKRGKLLGAILDEAESIAEFNRRIGMCQSSLYRILRRRRTKIKTLERICSGLNRPAEDFIEEVSL